MKRVLFPFLLVTTALLCGCLFPEKFNAKLTVNPDASYRVRFDGSVAYVPAVAQMSQTKKPLSVQDEAMLNAEARKLSNVRGITQASYAGNGRLNIALDDTQKAGMPLNVLDMIKVSTDKDGVMTIASPKLDEKTKSEIKKLGLNLSGTLEVDLPKNAEVLSSNTTSSPSFFGWIGSYAWKIGSIDQAPVMRIHFKK